MNTLAVFGLYASDGMPVMQLLEPYYDNSRHENTIEIARLYIRVAEARQFDGIMIIYRDDFAAVYSRNELTVR